MNEAGKHLDYIRFGKVGRMAVTRVHHPQRRSNTGRASVGLHSRGVKGNITSAKDYYRNRTNESIPWFLSNGVELLLDDGLTLCVFL